ncbi:hypothetical protein L1049_014919 [Liquidambar formosana]|uniref:AP complex mu/sigma subunit domain-containing protein n=1 Tax=Liquidambar formosana TaxID=63359 RepID=A0AAP0RX56_LIQFO
MIRAVIVMNNQGKPRLSKFYDFQPVEKQQELIRCVYEVLRTRAENMSNFIQANSIFGPDAWLVYKNYATLYFIFVFDSSENELAMLDLMQVFVETLDKCLSNACELDIVFNFSKVGKGLKCNHAGPKINDLVAQLIAHDFLSELLSELNCLLVELLGFCIFLASNLI